MGTRMLKAQGVIRRRSLVNALVDPEEAEAGPGAAGVTEVAA